MYGNYISHNLETQVMARSILSFILFVAVISALPVEDSIIRKLDPVRYHNVTDDDGKTHLADLWVKPSDLQEAARYNPEIQNVYHVFTRLNPWVSQPLLSGQLAALAQTNFSPRRRTAVLTHGWMGSATADVFSVLVPAFLAAEDINVIVADWSAGAMSINYPVVMANSIASGEAIARFVNWVCSVTGTSLADFHLVGYSVGGHVIGVVGRNLGGQVAYITSLDPAFPGWVTNSNRFRPDDGVYTEVIHTNIGRMGYIGPLGQIDIYPNGGIGMPGCDSNNCDHERSFHYFGESLVSGGFAGTRCGSLREALAGTCELPGGINMGGLAPKNGQSGIFYLETNAAPPFSK